MSVFKVLFWPGPELQRSVSGYPAGRELLRLSAVTGTEGWGTQVAKMTFLHRISGFTHCDKVRSWAITVNLLSPLESAGGVKELHPLPLTPISLHYNILYYICTTCMDFQFLHAQVKACCAVESVFLSDVQKGLIVQRVEHVLCFYRLVWRQLVSKSRRCDK